MSKIFELVRRRSPERLLLGAALWLASATAAVPDPGRSPPPQPWSQELVCHSDKDCALYPYGQPCSGECTPCGKWREAVTRKWLERWKKSWQTKKCRRQACGKCQEPPLGTEAVCVKGQCTVR
jgi:hypothetical protein